MHKSIGWASKAKKHTIAVDKRALSKKTGAGFDREGRKRTHGCGVGGGGLDGLRQ